MKEKLKQLLGQRVCVLHNRGYAYGILETWGHMSRAFRCRTPDADDVETDASFRFSSLEVRSIDHDTEPDTGGTINIRLTII